VTARFCSNCGKPLQPDQLCPYCGARVIASRLTPGGFYARAPLTRTRFALFAGLAVAILAFAVYVLIVSHDLTALLVGVLIVSILYGILIAFRPRPIQPPTTRLP